ncbi:hypothetical protein [Sphingomonas sp. NIBR02145]|uniref:hypothetical protein n=1 Tax=Sphingomonas sp. NIBR02145 TaxID=3014784 RepID=UPI0022B472A3|nr:hypothetical protein [Sphingomonas sp. NIBR02145]WHU01705.1 hypothetical protein O3305_16095 [Sphingomonas sp. NIBR02145]
MKLSGRKREDVTIHGIRLKVRPGTQPLPSPLIAAYVTAFSVAAEPREAVVKSVRALQAMGYDFEDVLPEGLMLPLAGWGEYVAQAWPEFSEEFPSQDEIAAHLAEDGVAFSPFAGFDRE